jgi:hypothetical protein
MIERSFSGRHPIVPELRGSLAQPSGRGLGRAQCGTIRHETIGDHPGKVDD